VHVLAQWNQVEPRNQPIVSVDALLNAAISPVQHSATTVSVIASLSALLSAECLLSQCAAKYFFVTQAIVSVNALQSACVYVYYPALCCCPCATSLIHVLQINAVMHVNSNTLLNAAY
jgi:hypothetical protein